MNNAISVLICEDSALMRKLIRGIIEVDSQLNVVATASNGLFALKKIPIVKPDIIILDIEMPIMNGLEFLAERKKQGIDIPVIILSSLARKGAKVTMEALELGASDFVLKPSGSFSMDIDKVGGQLRRLIHAYGSNNRNNLIKDFRSEPLDVIPPQEQKVALKGFVPASHKRISDLTIIEVDPQEYMVRYQFPQPSPNPPARGPIELVVIGISTGGPNALRKMLPLFSVDFPVPIVIVQHMPEGFTLEFAKNLNSLCALEVKQASPGDVLVPGKVFIAPGNYHVEVDRMPLASILQISQSDPVNGHRPSVDVLFSSVAKHYGNQALGVIMTGMGRDGARELGTLYNAGSWTLAQSKPSCVVYGMPRVATESGYVQSSVSLDSMTDKIVETVIKSHL